ncbi:glycosyltransferase family 4 protein [Thiocapsa bogorovii]|uniref:glycosyltransferase family 4 protein n=1 Tax=Thiocapsa bogorovii TaxID=521689 RepID=UPI001E545808|nr:glycosyltransferase family 4 protein [Thiocapsa bogorovii]UHD17118.1 glycosyltransferase family 4 protein [Thiocapsa bogorovii]
MTPKRRVAVVLPEHWSTSKGGAEYQAHQICTRLVETGNAEIHYLAKAFGSSPSQHEYRCTEVGSRLPLRAAKGTLLDSLRLWSALRRIRPDVIYQRVGSGYTGVCGLYARWHGCRFVWHIAHDYDVTPGRFAGSGNRLNLAAHKWLLERGIPRATHVIAQTVRQADLLGEHYRRHDAIVIPNSHPPPEPTTTAAPRTKIVWIANLKPIKRPEVFIRLAGLLSALEAVDLVMVGKPSWNPGWQSALEKAIASTPRLSYLGAITQDDVNALLKEALVLVSTSVAEGFPNTFIQAWMRGVPVVSFGADPDGVLEKHEIGFVADTEDHLATLVRRIVEDPALRERLAANARTYALANHGLANFDQLVSLLLDDRDAKA